MKASTLLPSSCPVVAPQPAIKTNDRRRLRQFFRALLAGLTLLVAIVAAPSRSQAQSTLLDCSCLATQAVLFTSACTSTIPDLCLVATNCYTPTPGFAPGFTCTQNPPPGTPVNTMTVITFTLTETSSGSNVTCQVTNYVGVFTNRFELLCPPDLTVPCNSTNWSFSPPGWTNTCCPSNSILINLLGVVTNWPTITALWQGIECQGLAAFCTNTITFADPNGLPCDCLEIICPPDQIIQTCLPPFPVPGAGTNVFYPLPFITNHCIGTITNVVMSPPSGSFFPVGTNTVTAIVQDDLGNAATCAFNVIVLGDTTPPVVTCATNQVVQCGTPWASIPPTAVDNCCSNLFIMLAGRVTNSVSACLETIEFHWHVMDCHGNAADCTNVVTVVDTLPPVINCNSNQIYPCVNAAGTPGGWTLVPPTAIDNCCTNPTVTLLNAVTNMTACTETITLTWQATDCCTNSAFCTEVITITDTNAPTLNCPPQRIVECGNTGIFDPPTASDACCGTNVTVTLLNAITNVQTACFSSYTLLWQATDCCTNSAICSQSVTVVDTTPPVATCAPDKTVECGTAWTFDPPTAVDACCGTNVTITVLNTVTNALGPCQRIAIRTWDIMDCCGNSVSCTQSVTLVDTTPPVINCVSNQFVQCGTAWTFTPPTAVDVCCGSAVQVFLLGVSTNIAGPCLEIYTALWEARDCCGNKSICTTTITVADTLPPVINCNSNQFYSCANAAGIPGGWTLVPPTATDNCCPNPTVTLINAVTNASACTEVITLTWQATDCCTNSSSCTEVITITDTNAPTINCAQVRLEECGTTWSFNPPTASDPCCGTNVTVTLLNAITNVQSTCFSSYTLLWQATDCCTNSTTCIENIIVQDTTPPVVTCAPDKHVECGTNWSFDPPTAVDACCSTNVTITVLSTVTNVPSFCPLIVTRTWDVSDCCGNSVTCSQTVFIQDTTPPVITCTNLTIQCGTPWTFTPPAVFDACCGSAVQVALVNVSTNIVGPCLEIYTAVWLATDCCGNKMDCIQTITVVDTLPPVIQCNTNQTFQCGGTAGTPGWTPTPPVAVDNCCTNVTVTLLNSVTNSIGCTNVITLTWEATDCCSNSAVCTEIVTIVDTTPPVIQCNPQRVEECGTTLAFTPPPAFDACCGTNVTVTLAFAITNTQSTCFSSYTLGWLAVDCCGNTASCLEQIFVVDTTPPVVVCAPNKTEQCGTPWSFDPPTGFDACCGTNIAITVLNTITNSIGQCPLIVTRLWNVTDCCGNGVSCSQTVIVEDSTPPVINCASNQVVQCGTQWSFLPPTATDNCCPASTISISLLGVVTNTIGPCQETYTALWEATDCCGNKSTCTSLVTVVDTLPPVVQCNTNQTYQCGGTPAWTLTPPVATDNCCPNVTVTLLSAVTNTAPCSEVITLTWEATDCCSNSTVCTEVVTLVDTTPPIITCAPWKIVECGTPWTFDDPTAFDACCGTNVTLTVVTTTTNLFSSCIKLYQRIWLATDCCTNTASCGQFVIEWDSTPPVLNCGPDQVVACGTAWTFGPPPTALDACCGTNVTVTLVSTAVSQPSPCTTVHTQTWQATDCCGNVATCSRSVTEVDNLPPVITCASNQVVQCGSPWTFTPPTANDNCCPAAGITLSILSTSTNTIAPCQDLITVVWQAMDCCGNTSTCTTSVTVIDSLPPVINCQSNLIVQCGTFTALPVPTVTDNCCPNPTLTLLNAVTNQSSFCLTVITRTWQATDCCTNTVICTDTVSIVDTAPPVLSCAPNKTLPCNANWSFDPPTVMDACCGTNITVSVLFTTPLFDTQCSQSTTRVWVATDCCGNSVTCSQTVTLVDNIPPVATCAPNKTVQCGSNWTFDPPTAIDACCGTNVTITIQSTAVGFGSPCTGHIRTWLITDCCGNSTTCSQSVNVVDTIPPTIVCAPSFTVNAGNPWSFTQPTAFDACCTPTILTLNTTTNVVGCNTTYTRYWRAVDCCGNLSPICSQFVTVLGTLGPPNDPCPNPIPLVLNAPYICGSNICATATPPGILSPIPCGLSVNSPDVWYTVTAQCTGPLTVDTCAPCPGYPTFDTVLSAYTMGNCNTLLTQVSASACNDDACGLRSIITFPAIAGQTYRIRVAGFFGSVGWFSIRATQPIIAPVNDLCVNAIPVNAGNPAACGTTICATPTPPGTLIPTPCGLSVNSPDVWYRFTPQCSGPVTINTCGTCPPSGTFDTVLSVYTGNCNGPLNQVVCNDDAWANGPCPWTLQSFVSFNATAGVTYYIRVAGFLGQSGNFRLNINQGLTPPANDLCFNATPVTAGTHVWNNCGANTDGPPAACQPTPDVWFNYTPTCSGLVMLNTCLSTINTVMSVYSGPCGGLSLIACNDNATAGSCNGSPQSFLTFNAIAGTTYRIRVGGAGGAQGGGVLNIVGPNPPANTCGTGPLSWRNFLVTGPGNGIPWAWSVSSPCCANLQNLNTPGVFGSPTTVATAFRNSINAVCPGTAVSFGPFLSIATRCGPTAPVILQVGPAGTAPQNLCVVGGTALPTSGPCSFNPEIVEVLLTGRDDNQNGIDDYIDIALGTSQDVNGNLIPDEVEDCFGPQFLAKPDSAEIELGADVTLSATVSGTPPFHYQWVRDGEPLPGATNSTLTISPVTESDLGAYSMIVSNDCGVLEGSGADVFVVPPTLPVIYDAQLTDGWFYFMVETKLGFEYLIEYKDDLNDTGWQSLMTVPGIGAPQLIFDSEPPPNHRFYRVQQLPGSPAQ